MKPGLLIADRFLIRSLLGQGGMGSVWLAHHTQLDVPCAVKFIEGPHALSAEMRHRFTQEAKAAALLRSPHVVQIFDAGTWEGTPYLAMELLEGEELSKRLKRVGRLAPVECAVLADQVARALGKAHAAGITHRDLKPDNIFLVRDEGRELVKILDFGIAKRATGFDGGATKDGAFLGTPLYMSPEQTRNSRSVDYRSDLWSFAIIVFECLTGRRPFEGDSLGDILMKIGFDPLPVPSHVAPDLPPAFDAWWARAAERDPQRRHASAREMVDALAVSLGVSFGSAVGLQPDGARASLPSAAPAPTVLMQPHPSAALMAPAGQGVGRSPLASSGPGPGLPPGPGAYQRPPGAPAGGFISTTQGGALAHPTPSLLKTSPPSSRRLMSLLALAFAMASLTSAVAVGLFLRGRRVERGAHAAALRPSAPAPSASATGVAIAAPPISAPPAASSAPVAVVPADVPPEGGGAKVEKDRRPKGKAGESGSKPPPKTDMGFLPVTFMKKRNVSALVLLAACLFSNAAAAQSDADRATARQLGREGVAALQAKDYAKALDLFTRAERLYDAPTLKLGRARALAGTGKLLSAYETYQDIVRAGAGPRPSAAFRKAVADAGVESAKLEPRLGNITVTVEGAPSAEVTLDGEPLSDAAIGVKRPVDPGTHVAKARAEGYNAAEASVRVGEGASETVALRLEPRAAPPVAAAGPVPQAAAPAARPLHDEGPGPDAAGAGGSSGRKTVGFVALGVGGAALVTGGVFGLMAAGKHSKLKDSCESGHCPPEQRDTLDSYRSLGTVSTVAVVAGAVGVGAGAFLLLTAPKAKPDAASAGLWLGPASAGVAGRF